MSLRRGTIRALLLALLWVSGCRDPDVVLITVDTLRVDHVGAFAPDGQARAGTPHIDELARDGVVYTQAWSPISVTGPSFCTVHTGQDPGTHGVVMNAFRGGGTLKGETQTLAEALHEQDYATGAFVSGFTLRRALGLGQGFDTYDQPTDRERNRLGEYTTQAALEWLGQQGDRKILLWYHSFDAHGPLNRVPGGPEPHLGWTRRGPALDHIPAYQVVGAISDASFYEQAYANAVEYADIQVGRVLAALKARDRYDKALIVFLADHGESFTERELWFDHGTTPYAEQLHVPLIVKYPKGRDAGTRVDALVGLRDVAPTVMDLVGGRLEQADGRSLRGHPGYALLTGESSHCKKNAALSCRPWGPGGKLLAVRSAKVTLVRVPGADGITWERYDRVADPAEQHPLQGDVPDDMRAALEALHAQREAMHLPDPPQLRRQRDEETRALQALGYIEPQTQAQGQQSAQSASGDVGQDAGAEPEGDRGGGAGQ